MPILSIGEIGYKVVPKRSETGPSKSVHGKNCHREIWVHQWGKADLLHFVTQGSGTILTVGFGVGLG